MKKSFLSIIFALVLGLVFADNDNAKSVNTSANPNAAVVLTGQVVDFNSGEALTGVEIKIDGTDIKTYTDFDGNFQIDNVKPGEYSLIASYISYKNSLVENLKADKDINTVDIKLQPSN